MEVISRPQDIKENSHGSNTISNNNGSSSSSLHHLHSSPTPPSTPKTISRSETNPYPTTFVQADTSTFKQVVQMLTGSSETAQQASKTTDPSLPPSSTKSCIPPVKTTTPKKQGFKLYERRNSLKNGFMISPLVPGFVQNSSFSPRKAPEILSPSILDFPSLVISSPVTPLIEDPFDKSSSSSIGSSSEEDKAIAEKKFYLHPSPRNTPRDCEPQLLPLFPVTSPKISGSSS